MYGIYAKTMKMIKGGLFQPAMNHALFAQGDVKAHHSDEQSAALTQNKAASRLRTALLLFPLFLSMAFYSVLPSASFDAMLFTALSFAGLSLILLAAQAFGVQDKLTNMLALSFYSVALAFTTFYAGANNAVVWAMVLALPLEIWLVTGARKAVMAGAVLACGMVAVALIKGLSADTVLPAGLSTVFLFTYVGALLLRAMRASIRTESTAQLRTEGNTADKDLETALDALVIRLDKDGNICSLSDRSIQQFGVDRAVLNGTLLLDRVHVADRVQYLAFLNGLKNGSPAMRLSGKTEIRLRCVDTCAADTGDMARIYFAAFEMEGQTRDSSEGESFLLIARNMAATQETQNRFLEQTATIENLEVSRSRMLGTVSHELRTPLNSIIGFSDLLLHDVAGPLQSDKQREYIDLIRKSGNHLLEVVNSILEASRLEAGHYPVVHERFSVRDSVTMCNAMLMPIADKKGVILCDRIHPSVEDMIGDRRAIQQILINLVSNAVKFTDRGGCVTIEVMPEAVKRGYAGATPRLIISVSDTGIGLDAGEIKRLCQPFTQINNVQTRMQEGSGLGLYLVKGLVSLHEGEMDIRSRKGQGTTVSVHLPQTQAQLAHVVDNTGFAADQASSAAILKPQQPSTDVSSALEQVKTAIINLQAQQAESSYDGKTEPQRHATQGKFHAQKRKTA